MFRSWVYLCLVCALALATFLLGLRPPSATGQAPAPAAARPPVSFLHDVVPIFKEYCFGCHNPRAASKNGKLDMTTWVSFRKPGSEEDPLVNGKPDDSPLMSRLKATGPRRMPPRVSSETKVELDALPPDKIAVIERWIKEGAQRGDVGEKANLLTEWRLHAWKPPLPPQTYNFPTIVTSLAFTPDGKKVVVGGHHELTVWDIDTAKLEKRIATRAERAKAMLFLADGKLVVAGSRPGQEGDARIYDINAAAAKELWPPVDGVSDKTVMLKELVSIDEEILCLSASDDGKRLAAGGCDRLVRVWDLSNGLDKAKLVGGPKENEPIENHADWVLGVALAPDGKHLFTASRDKTAKVWDMFPKRAGEGAQPTGGESVLTFTGHQVTGNVGVPVYGVAASGDSTVGYSVGEDGNLRRWNAQTDSKDVGKEVGSAPAHAKGAVKIVMHPKLIVTCGADNTAKIWNPTGQAPKTLSGHTDHVLAVAISPDGSLVASGSYDGEVRIWKAEGTLVKAFNASPGYVAAAHP